MPAPGPTERITAAKRQLRRRIAARRQRCAALTVRVVTPLRWLDHVEAWWRSLGPLGKLGGAVVAWGAWRWARRSDAGQPSRAGVGWGAELTGWVANKVVGAFLR